ncbi:hypothetical protein [Ancylobacter mangrovi]|uniref:hypothetical protein n=1 Tax=Ancylobacter mangrovi TaxID=2972472 RepID=UPI002163DD8F|nr:hypothetical protein [Ancylobacter mangrovi]MCS0504368.1 hypothetical protein [Ancylobacter mangrovi]
MRSASSLRFALFAAALACAPSLALAQGPITKMFVVDSSDGYGIDTCLSAGDACGQAVADAWCRVHDFQRAASYGKAASLVKLVAGKPAATDAAAAPVPACLGGTCAETVTITCSQ